MVDVLTFWISKKFIIEIAFLIENVINGVSHRSHRTDLTFGYPCKYQSRCEVRKFEVNKDSNGALEVVT